MSERPDISKKPYHGIIREERNFAAVLYHYLLIENNLKAFLACVNEEKFENANLKNAEVYFEFAYLRDWWHKLKEDDEKELAIDSLLGINGMEVRKVLEGIVSYNKCEKSVYNVFTGSEEKRIKSATGSPSRWQMSQLIAQLGKNNPRSNKSGVDIKKLFFKMCMLKWAFNAKPDLVIALRNNNSDEKITHSIVIEAKMESGCDKYPSKHKDGFTKILKGYKNEKYIALAKKGETKEGEKKRFVCQLALQRYLFDQLLVGVGETTYVQLLEKEKDSCECNNEEKANGSIVRTWEQVFKLNEMKEVDGSLNTFIGHIKGRIHQLAGH